MINIETEERILEANRQSDADEWTMAMLRRMNYSEVVEWYKSYLADRCKTVKDELGAKRAIVGERRCNT